MSNELLEMCKRLNGDYALNSDEKWIVTRAEKVEGGWKLIVTKAEEAEGENDNN